MAAFARHISINYSGATKPTASLKGLRVYLVEGDAPHREFRPTPSATNLHPDINWGSGSSDPIKQ
jgi:hypothetical protein